MIPFNRPTVAPGQLEFVGVIRLGAPCRRRSVHPPGVSGQLSVIHDGAGVLLTTSCTAALELSALLLELEPGDEVIVPSFTFVSSANAFAVMGARIVFVDIDPDTLNLAGEASSRDRPTSAIVAVNYGGVPSVSDELLALADANGIG